MPAKIKTLDHLGNEYDSVSDMCRAYGISIRLYYDRLNRKYSLKEALTMPLGSRKNRYTIEELSESKGIKDVHKLAFGLAHGMSISDIKRWDSGKGCVDHKGNYFKNFEKMCRAYGKNSSTVRYRLKSGLGLDVALET